MSRLSDLTAITSPADTDLLYMRVGSFTDSDNRKITAANLRAYVLGSGVTFDNANGNLLFDAGGTGKVAFSFGANVFNATNDPTLVSGYNMKYNGALITSNEPALGWVVEGNYNDGSGANKMEGYLQFVKSDGLSFIRPIFFQFNRSTNAVSSTLLAGNPVRLQNVTTPGTEATIADFYANLSVLYAPTSSTDNILRLKASSSAGSSVRLGYNQLDDVINFGMATRNIMNVNVDGAGSGSPVLRTNSLWLFGRIGSLPIDAMSIGVQDNNAVATFAVNGYTGLKGLVIRGISSWGANAFEVQNSGSTPLLTINQNGVLFPVQAATASAPAYVKGGMYFDTTLNKMRIGGATAWETVTSS